MLLLIVTCIVLNLSLNWAEVVRLPEKCRLKWLHPPKTVSTFCLSIQHACNEVVFLDHATQSNGHRMAHGCPILTPVGSAEGNRFHGPLSKSEINNADLNDFVTVLREPSSRIISTFCDGVDLHYGLTKQTKVLLNEQFNSIDQWNWKRNKTLIKQNFQVYLKQPFIYGCYVRLLSGYSCNEEAISHNEVTNLIPKAIETIDQFLFAGISENYNKTLQLFYEIAIRNNITKPTNLVSYTTNTNQNTNTLKYSNPNPIELIKLSEISNSKTCETKLKDIIRNNEILFQDPFDSIIYTHVKEKLQRLDKSLLS